MNRAKACAWLSAGSLLMGTSVIAWGHGGATGIVAERMMGMMMLGEQVKILASLAENAEATDTDKMRDAAAMIEMHAGPAMTGLFPEGSLDAPSVARPEIWERWEEFEGYSIQLAELGQELVKVADVSESQPALSDVAEVPAPAPPSEWDRMNFASLMGLADRSDHTPVGIDTQVTGSIRANETSGRPPMRTAKAVLADITGTCSSCHAAFRR